MTPILEQPRPAPHAGPAWQPHPAYAADPPAGFWRRTGAYLVDGLILGIPTRLLDRAIANTWLSLLVVLGVSAAYFILFWRNTGRTLGYQAFGLRLATTDGRPLGWGPPLARYVVLSVFLTLGTAGLILLAAAGMAPSPGIFVALGLALFAVGLLDFAWVGWDPRKQAWHDKAAGTLVLHETRSRAQVG